MKNTEEIRDLAIKTHDIDADKFQSAYSGNKSPYDDVFLYGRAFIGKEIMQALSALPKGAKILDIGCGTGHLAAEMKSHGFDVYGMEPSKDMIGHARKNFPDIEFKEGVSVALPYADNQFDFIISIEVLRYLSPDDVVNTYKEIQRVLKKDGTFLITHVNKYATDFYYVFFHLKDLIKKITNQHHHYCYFTTAGTEMDILKRLNYASSYSYGRMFGSIRIGYKFGVAIGKLYAKFLEVFNKEQLFKNNPWRAFAGHLFLFGKK